jgi:SAM-dependent MidA family methyltransferase
MEACNSFYYATRDPLGRDGDFTTAPEISQMFGELVGAVLADCWRRAGSPTNVRYVELGPGRGTLARDALRVMRSAGLDPQVHLVETSPTLRAAQSALLGTVTHHEQIGDLPAGGPLLVVANEFLDALPVRHHVGGVERQVEWIGDGLAFNRDGEVVESSPARDEAVRALAEGLVALGGAALVIDYGHNRSASGDTLQAVRNFQRVGQVAREAGAFVAGPAGQGEWLERLGIQARARVLANAAPARADEIEQARARLCRPDQMGSLFKVLAIHSPEWPRPAGL